MLFGYSVVELNMIVGFVLLTCAAITSSLCISGSVKKSLRLFVCEIFLDKIQLCVRRSIPSMILV
jgi:hypothetical protein